MTAKKGQHTWRGWRVHDHLVRAECWHPACNRDWLANTVLRGL